MKTQIPTVLLFISVATALPLHKLNEIGINENKNATLEALDLYILNDEGEPVVVDLFTDDEETEEETRKDLHNRVHYYLYTKNIDRSRPQTLVLDDVNGLKKSDFNSRRPTVIITHGWMNSYKSDACKLIRDAYLKREDYNVIVLDWSSISIRPYLWCSKRVLMVSQYTSKMINYLENHGMDVSKLTIVGHSLGGHIAGLSAHYAKHQVNYVVALDPALPNFDKAGPGNRVAKGDARHVQIIHTNGGILGYKSPIGDTDFYPNGGSQQVGCTVDVGGVCSHPRAYEYFAESITNNLFLAARCDSYEKFRKGVCKSPTSYMGGITPKYNTKGTYYLTTKAKSPFGQALTKVEFRLPESILIRYEQAATNIFVYLLLLILKKTFDFVKPNLKIIK
ncbi:lipoprotein lipase-like [Calliopsis andreniformis]|uniref:lipoprotein lipase-like n=1 Tax=Calliopsis andreniformis TaxID=337506 RepID=UPI003FCCB7D4